MRCPTRFRLTPNGATAQGLAQAWAVSHTCHRGGADREDALVVTVDGVCHGPCSAPRNLLFRASRCGCYESLSSATRARHHDRVGHELEARRRRGMPVDAAALAHHFGRAAPFGNAAPAFTYALGAAAEAEALLSFDVAAGRFEQALAMLAIDPGLGGGLDVKLALGDAPVAAGDVSRARRTFSAVAEEAAWTGDPRALGQVSLGFSGGMTAMEVVISDAEVCQLLDRAVEALPDDDVLGARLAARLSVALSHRAPLAQPSELASRALVRAEAGRDSSVIAEALAAWCDVVAAPTTWSNAVTRRARSSSVPSRSATSESRPSDAGY